MRKLICLMMALLMLLGMIGCAKVEEAAAPVEAPVVEKTEEPEPTPEPTPDVFLLQQIPNDPAPVPTENPDKAVKNTDEQIDAVMKPYYKWAKLSGYPGAPSLRYGCSYVSMPKDKDWKKVKTNGLNYLYNEVPYNIGVADMGNKPSQFMTNKELIEQIGEKQVRYYGDKGSLFADYCGFNYPHEMTVDKMTSKYKECDLPDAVAQQLATERVNFHNLHPFTREVLVGYDELLVYRDAAGIIRCRVEYNSVIRDASDEFCISASKRLEDLQHWNYTPMDILIYTDEAGTITDMKLAPLGDTIFLNAKAEKTLERLLKECCS